MNATVQLLHSVLPASVGLRVRINTAHPSAQILGTDRMGSGTIVDAAGIVLTVNYVVLGAETIEVTLLDETRLTGQVIAQDFYSGLAAIKIPEQNYRAVRLGSSQGLAPGDDIFIVASAGGSQRRVNTGAVMSLDRFDAFWEFSLERGIVTTARNPGLGGGGLFTTAGAMVGVVSLDLNEVGRFTLGVPVEHWSAHTHELLQHGRRTSRRPRAWVGFYCYMLSEHVIIAGVLPGTPSERGGLRPGDVVVAVDDQPIAERHDLYARLWEHRPGDVIRFQVFRDDAIREVLVESADAEAFFA
ncbi:MAG TPA: S1C family serine protease [Candidatus Dormibacteraeota bacterium]|nr:S1C family serine protease [Candidatus Dormibacteraeota bacterium]